MSFEKVIAEGAIFLDKIMTDLVFSIKSNITQRE